MTNLNREPIGPFHAPERGWDGQEPELPSLPDTMMEDNPGIYQDLLSERDEAMQRYERVRAESQRLRAALQRIAETISLEGATIEQAQKVWFIATGALKPGECEREGSR